MHIPPGMTEAQVLEAIEQAVDPIAQSFTFGPYAIEDVKQEGRVYALEALPRYDPGGFDMNGFPLRPLPNFLRRHVKYRLINLRRDKLKRADPPCHICHRASGDGPTEHEDGQLCEKYLTWKKRQERKAALMWGTQKESASDVATALGESHAEDAAQIEDVLRLIDESLDVELRGPYLMMRAGVAVPKSLRHRVETVIKEILEEAG